MLIPNTGTQYVEGELSFDPGFQIFLYESVFSVTGDYILFDYSAGSFPGGQTELNNNVTVFAVDLKLSYVSPLGGLAVLENQPEHSRVIVKLLSKSTNGKQWIEGDLNFTGPTTLYLDRHLFATAGENELFEVTGEITGVEHLTVVHGGGFLTGSPFVDPLDPKKVKIILVKSIGVNNANVSQSYALPPEIVQLTKRVHLPTAHTVVSETFTPAVVAKLSLQECSVSLQAYDLILREKASTEIAITTSIAISPRLVQSISLTNSLALSYAFDPSFKTRINTETLTIFSSLFNPAVKQILLPNNTSSLCHAFNPFLVQACRVETLYSTSTCIDPLAKRVSRPSFASSVCISPNLNQKITLSFANVTSSVFNLRTGIGVGYWYSYFPMACFEGLISRGSQFKIMILGSAASFNSDRRYISDIPGHLTGVTNDIPLKDVYISNTGDVVYDFDSVTFEQQNFSFQNAVIYANNHLVLHINWARDFSLIGQTVTIDVPQVSAIARPLADFGTLELEPYIETPAVVQSIAYSPAFPLIYPEVAFVSSFAINPNPSRISPGYARVDSFAFNPTIQGEIIDAVEGPDLIEMSEEDVASVDAIAFSPVLNQKIVPEFASTVSRALDPIGPPQNITLEDYSYPQITLFNPQTIQKITLSYALVLTTTYQSPVRSTLTIETANILPVEICPPVVYKVPAQDPAPPEKVYVEPIRCADPFYDWRPKVSKVYDLNPSKLEGYWTLDNHLRDESLNRKNLSFVSLNSENSLSNYDSGKLGQGFRGHSYLKDNIVYSDFLESNHSFNVGRKFSVQMWFKVDFDDILIDKNVALIEQMSWCWNNGPSFPGSVGWSLHSSCNSETIQFQFNIVDGKSCIRTNANIDLLGGFQLSQKWHHVLFTRDDHQTFLYVDGAQYGSGENERVILGQEPVDHIYNVIDGISLKVGNSLTSGLRPLMTTNSADLVEGGVIPSESIVDDIAIWSKSLSQDEVARLWLEGSGVRADSLPHKSLGISTAEITQFRQGVELTHPLHYNVGLYKIYSGVRDTHRKFPGDFGNTKPVDSCNLPFVDVRGWNPLDFARNYPHEYFVKGEKPITDGVIKVISQDSLKPEIMIGSLIRTNIKINDLPNASYIDNGYINNEAIPITPFIDDETKVEGYNPLGYISQGNGFDHEASTSRGTDSISYGGMTY